MNLKFSRPSVARPWLALALLVVPVTSWAVDATFDLIETRTTVYSNVTVTTKSKDYIVIQHAAGLASVKVAELSPEVHEALGYGPAKGATKGGLMATAQAKALVEKIPAKEIEQAWVKYAPTGTPALDLSPKVLLIGLGALVVLHLLFSYCASLICHKAGKPGGALVWFPILQFIPLLRAANMSPFWLLALFVPLLNIVAHLLWSFKIAKARGRGLLTAVFLILPTYPLAFLYLAFAGTTSTSNNESGAGKAAPGRMAYERA